MTAAEADRIHEITLALQELTVEVKTANALNTLELKHMKILCNERHGGNVQRVEHLERSERKSYGKLNQLKGAIAPAAIFVALVSLIISFVGRG